MQHFVNFSFTSADIVNRIPQGFVGGYKIGANVGSGVGLLRGSGAFETEEEKANTTAMDRAGKLLKGYIFGTGIGGAIGAGAGTGAMALSKGLNNKYGKVNKDPYYNPNRDAGETPQNIPIT